ncbi:MAG: LysM domain-containing protein [Anaerolineales bacterium]|jgi:LysM repeat protein
MNTLRKISLVLMALMVMSGLVAATFQPAAAAIEPAATCEQWHTVVRGEYLVQIARQYNTDWSTLAEINGLTNPSLIYYGQKLCVSAPAGSGSVAPLVTSGSSTVVRVVASSVKEDKEVTLSASKLLANTRYSVYLGKYATYPSEAVLVGWVYSDARGAFYRTFNIPGRLADVSKIYISVSNGRGDLATNWFINATADGNTGGLNAPAFSFSIVSTKSDQWVKIKTSNLPANVAFDVTMGKSGTKGVDGILVGTLRDEDGGTIRATYDIPGDLHDRSKIDIRLENKQLGLTYYLTFEN